MNFEKNVWLKTPYRVKIFQNFHFQKHSPIYPEYMGEKKSIQYYISNTMFTWVCCRELRFLKFFSPIISGWEGKCFGSEKFEKIWPHIRFSSELLFKIEHFLQTCGPGKHVDYPNIWYWSITLMNFEIKVRVETPYGVKNFQNFHFQKHPPTIQKRWAKKNSKNSIPYMKTHTHPHFPYPYSPTFH